MKPIFTLLIFLLFAVSGFAQTPQKMSYQAVVRNSTNELVFNTVVGMRISILQGDAFGTVVFSESQLALTNANGLASIEIGSGTPITNSLATVDWSNGPYFIKTETDPSGGTNYTIEGTSQLLSVPYALYAEKSNIPYLAFNALINSTERNIDVLSTTSLTITETGYYLATLSGTGNDSDTVTTFDDTDYDVIGRAFVYNETAGVLALGNLPFVQPDSDLTGSSIIRRMEGMNFSTTAVVYFSAGDVLRCGGRMYSNGSPTAIWELTNLLVTLVKVR